MSAGVLWHGVSGLLRIFGAHLLFIQEYVHVSNLVGGSWTLSLEIVWYFVISVLFLFSAQIYLINHPT